MGKRWGDAVLSSSVIGRSVFDFISGDETRMYLGALLQHSRFLNRTLVRPYRCDSPALRRYMEMWVSPDEGDLVRLDHVLLRAGANELPVVYRFEADPDVEALFRCRVCPDLPVKFAVRPACTALERRT